MNTKKRKRTWLQIALVALIDFAGLGIVLLFVLPREFSSRNVKYAVAFAIVFAVFCVSDWLGGRLARLIEGARSESPDS